MARSYKPASPFSVPMLLLQPTTSRVQGVTKKVFPDPTDEKDLETIPSFWGSLRTFGGSETERDGEYVVVDTATIDTWYDPAITADCRIYLPETGQTYEIIADPEDISMRHQYMQLKVHRIGGKA